MCPLLSSSLIGRKFPSRRGIEPQLDTELATPASIYPFYILYRRHATTARRRQQEDWESNPARLDQIRRPINLNDI